MNREFTVTKTEIVSGVRIPTAGRGSVYYINEIYPDGLTNGDINSMDKEYYFKNIEPRVKREAVLLGQPAGVEFDSSKIVVNDIQPLSFFSSLSPTSMMSLIFRSPASPLNHLQTRHLTPMLRSSVQREQQTPLTRSTKGWNSFPWPLIAGVNALAILIIFGVRAIRSRLVGIRRSTLPQIDGDSN